MITNGQPVYTELAWLGGAVLVKHLSVLTSVVLYEIYGVGSMVSLHRYTGYVHYGMQGLYNTIQFEMLSGNAY